jgi:3-isopropylmalate/(R)-2-methylmalate dehydratase small subunit
VKVEGTALRVRGDDIDTDVMYPGSFLNLEDPAEMATHLFEGFDPALRDRLAEGTIIVVDENFGIGSSREHVPLAMKANGIVGVLGRSFARIFFRNCVNLGLAISRCPEAVAVTHDGSRVAIDTAGGVEVDGVRFAAPPAPPFLLELSSAGGLAGWTARQVASDRGATSERIGDV